jgi:hypothetical protein
MTGSRSRRASSGSRSASSSIEPLRSAKRTVTCLRSPALFDVRIFSAGPEIAERLAAILNLRGVHVAKKRRLGVAWEAPR